LIHTLNKLVCGFHCDAYGHVNNARYLEFFEEARWTALNDYDLVQKLHARQLQFFVVNINVDFKKPVVTDDVAFISTHLGNIKRKTISFIQTIEVSGQTTTKAEVTFVLFDTKEKRAVSITDDLIALFKPLEHA
jgi:thioesterase III